MSNTGCKSRVLCTHYISQKINTALEGRSQQWGTLEGGAELGGREPCWEPPDLGLRWLCPSELSDRGPSPPCWSLRGDDGITLGARVCLVLSIGPGTWKAPARGAITDLIMTIVIVGRGEGVFSPLALGICSIACS